MASKKKHKKHSHNPVLTAANSGFEKWHYYILIAASFATPLFFSSIFTNTFELSKMAVLYVLALLALTITVFNWLQHKSIYLPSTALNIPILLFVVALSLATLFSIHPYTSLVGSIVRINGGLASFITYIIFFYITVMALSPVINGKSEFLLHRRHKLLWIWLGSAGLVGLIGVLQHYGIDLTCAVKGEGVFATCWNFDPKYRVFSTLVHPNLLAAYMAMIIPIGIMMLVKASKLKAHIFAFVVIVLCYAALWYAYSRAGLVGLGVSLIVLSIATPWSLLKSKWRWLLSLVVACAFITTVGFSLTALRTDSLFEETQISESTATTRFLIWESALGVFQDNPILGIGPSTFGYKFHEYRPEDFNNTMEWSHNVDRAHNQVLGMMVSAGIVGALTWLSLISISIWYAWKRGLLGNLNRITNKIPFLQNRISDQSQDYLSNNYNLTTTALVSGLSGLLTSQLLGFASVTSNLLFYITLAAIVAPTITYKQLNLRPAWRFYVALILMSAIILSVIYGLSRYLQANMSASYASKYTQAKYSDAQSTSIGLQRSINGYQRAIQQNPYEPSYFVGLANTFIRIAQLVPDSEQQGVLLSSADQNLIQATKLVPFDIELLAQVSEIYFEMAQVNDEYYLQSLNSILKAKELAPKAPNLYVALGSIYLAMGEYSKSLTAYNHLIKLMPQNASFYLMRAEYWKAVGNADGMEQDILKALKLTPSDKSITKQIKQLQGK